MSYTLTIGKARYIGEVDEYGDYHGWTVDECEGPAPHTDEWEASPHAGEPIRLPGYSQWQEVLEALPAFHRVWDHCRTWARENRREVIPVTEYVRELDAVEREAANASPESAARAYWFSRWSRHALKLYGEAAAFETPGEWIDWAIDPAERELVGGAR